jgi:uridine kinase
MSERQEVLARIASYITELTDTYVQLVAIDGVDGAGKTTFASELAPYIESSGRPVIRASVDGFRHPGEAGYKSAEGSPEGYFNESYNYQLLKKLLIEPLSPGGSGIYVPAVFNVETNSPIPIIKKQAKPRSILLLDGIFLHRPELRMYWDYSIFLDVNFDISARRCHYKNNRSPNNPAREKRYVEGQKIYLSRCNPKRYASIIVDNNDLNKPVIKKIETGT